MKAKVIYSTTEYVESTLNKWLRDRPTTFRVVQMTQTQNGNYITITILYEE
jgi:hypothetical protein